MATPTESKQDHYEALMEVIQGSVDGFTEAHLMCQIAADRGRLIVPHCWKSDSGIASSAHLSAATANAHMW